MTKVKVPKFPKLFVVVEIRFIDTRLKYQNSEIPSSEVDHRFIDTRLKVPICVKWS